MSTPAVRPKRLPPTSLTQRVFALYAGTLVLFVGLGLGLFLNYQFQERVVAMRSDALRASEVTLQALRDSAVIGDYDTIQKTLDKAVLSAVIGTASFADNGGARLQAQAQEPVRAQPPLWLQHWVERRVPPIVSALEVGGKSYGQLRLEFDCAHIADALWSVSELALGLGAFALLGGLLVIRFMLGQWLGSLEQLRGLLTALGQGKPVDAERVSANAPREIRQLVDILGRTALLVQEREATRLALNNQIFALDQHAIVSITDLQGCITYANDRFCAISGYAREELLGNNHRLVKSGHHPASYFESMWHTICQGQVWHGEICNRRRDGTLYWVSASIVPMCDASGMVNHYIAIRTDITERKAIEDSLQLARVAAEQANIAKSQFLANMSHEIRTPMNGILGMLGLLQNTPLNPQQHDYATKTEGAARSLLALLNDILDFSKVEAGKMQLDLRPFRMDELLRDLHTILVATLGEKDLQLHCELDPALPALLLGDSLRLQQVLLNLGGNAIKFTPSGEVRIQVRLLQATADEVVLQCAVHDTGIGIAPHNQAHIFDGFSQAEASTTRRYGGTGLGLAISQRLVALMGGQLQLQSELGQGSTFHFDLRLARAPQTPITAPALAAATAGPVQRLSGLRLLVVEDNKINQMVARGLLEKEGAKVALADDGALGVAAVAADPEGFDAVLMDLQMPVMDGYAATHAIREQLGRTALPIIAISANALPSDRAACLAAGMVEHIAKPYHVDHLVEVIRGQCNR